MSTRDVASLLLGLSVAMWGVSLIHDPWAQERYERMCRETARLNNYYLWKVDLALEVMPYFGYALMAAAFLIMNRLRFLSIFAIVPPIALGLLYYNPYMYYSERFGYSKNITGVLFTTALASSILLSSMRTQTEIDEQKAQKQAKAKELKKPQVADDKPEEKKSSEAEKQEKKKSKK